ncbi:MAG: M28 family peptidase [Defluviitaleaceae bacterium]|nr:M28 family peptidase [Defluviitaleaceae bacterium]
MKRTKLAMVALVLVIVMAMPVMVAASPWDDIPQKEAHGEVFVPVREAAYAHGLEVDWNHENREVILMGPFGDIFNMFPISEAFFGEFFIIEDDRVWLPQGTLEFIFSSIPMVALAEPSRTDYWQLENFLVRESVLSTDLPHGEISLAHIEFMNDNLYSRTPFSYREKMAARWIVEELLAMGYDWDAIEVQEFAFVEVYEMDTLFNMNWGHVTQEWRAGDIPQRESQLSQNVILTLPGQSERKIIVAAHYDTLPYPGASDNASGTALLLESAQRMMEHDNYHTIVYIFVGAEEVGLLGTYFFYDSLTYDERDNIVLMINADVLFEGPYFLYGAGAHPRVDEEELNEIAIEVLALMGMEIDLEDAQDIWWFDEDTIIREAVRFGILEIPTNAITEQIDAIAAEVQYLYDIELIARPSGIYGGSDHLVFVYAGHTVVNLSGMERTENVEDFPAEIYPMPEFTGRLLHSPRDDFHYIEYNWPGKMADAMRTFSIFLEGLLLARF